MATGIEETATFWSASLPDLFKSLNADENGLTESKALERLKESDQVTRKKPWINNTILFLSQFKSPLVLILIAAVVLSLSMGDYANSAIVLIIILLSGILGYWQEKGANTAIDKLKSMVQVRATVKRDGVQQEIPIERVVPGDIVVLNAGDIIPGDGRLLQCNDLHVNEAALTGESFPAEKSLSTVDPDAGLSKRSNSVFQGTSVINGSAVCLVVRTGKYTAYGNIAVNLQSHQPETAFEKGTKQFGYLLLQLTLGFSFLILLLNMYMGKPVIDSALFALALAIGITPELLPAIITISLSNGAKRMAEKKVVVKKLNAIQNLGAIDILCTDKTGTLTEGIVKVHSGVDVNGNPSDKVLQYAYWNALFETGFTNPIDEAIRAINLQQENVTKVDEVPYDFIRKRLSVVVNVNNCHLMITKGAVKNILSACKSIAVANDEIKSLEEFRDELLKKYEEFGKQGFRTIGIAYKDVTTDPIITKDDEYELTFLGFLLMFDPPKPEARQSLQDLKTSGISIKLITGDNLSVASYLGKQVGLPAEECLTGSQLRLMSDEALLHQVERITIFAETEPDQKERIVRILQKSGHTVGYIGDGINDASAMKTADVGISVDTAVDIARETADIVLLQRDLDVLQEGVREGRKTFLNTLKYIFITTSANFGNMFSVAGASLFLPFLPLLPKQILLINFISDLPAMALTSDAVEKENLHIPQKWNSTLIRNFMIVFGLQSTVFDFLTFYMLYILFKADISEFRTGWFIECVMTELMILLIIRSGRPFLKSRPGKYLVSISIFVAVLTYILTFQPFASWLGLVQLPVKMLAGVFLLVVLYSLTAEYTKRLFFRRHSFQY